MKSSAILPPVFAFTLLFPFSAISYPNVGDFTEYSGFVSSGARSIPYLKSVEVIGFNQRDQKWVLVEYEILGDTKSSRNIAEEADSIFTKNNFKDIMTDCLKYEGSLEAITVSAGIFPTCKFTGESTEIWYGDVPFGIIKKIGIEDGVTTTYELRSFRSGPQILGSAFSRDDQ